METSSRIVSPELRPDSAEFARNEKSRIRVELIAKYRMELQTRSWLGRLWIRFKIWRETEYTFRRRLYSAVKSARRD